MNQRFNKLLQYCKHDKSYQCRTSISLCMQNSTSIISIILDSTCDLHIIVYRDGDFSNSTGGSNKQAIYCRYLKRMCNDLKKTIHFFSQDIRIFIENVHIFLKNVCGLKKLGECLKPILEVPQMNTQTLIRLSGVPIDLKKYLFF